MKDAFGPWEQGYSTEAARATEDGESLCVRGSPSQGVEWRLMFINLLTGEFPV